MRELRAEYEELGRGAFSGRTVANMIDDYATVWSASEPSKTNRDRNIRFGRVISSYFGATRKITGITVSDCDALLAAYVAGPLASSGRPVSREYAGRLKAFVAKAFGNELRLGYLKHNPATEAKIPISEAAKRSRRALTATEWRTLHTQSTGIVRLVIDLCGRHGLRPQELRSVRWNDVDLDGGTLSVIVKPKTEKSIRTIRLHPEAVELLCQWSSEQSRLLAEAGLHNEQDLVATTSAGTPIDKDNLERSVRTLRRHVDIPAITPYELRHTAITHQIEAGWTANQVAEWVGTSVRMIDKHYRHKLAEISELPPPSYE